jgi:hypothetical protein
MTPEGVDDGVEEIRGRRRNDSGGVNNGGDADYDVPKICCNRRERRSRRGPRKDKGGEMDKGCGGG